MFFNFEEMFFNFEEMFFKIETSIFVSICLFFTNYVLKF